MGLDIRLPIGLLFTLLGVLIGGFGLLADPAIYARTFGVNVNFVWGCVLFAFGALMLGLWRRSARSARAALPGA
jgi:hypothetical protein